VSPTRPPLNTFVFGVAPPERYVEQLRSQFSSISILVAPGERFAAALPGAHAAAAWQINAEELRVATDLVWFQSIAAGVESVLSPELLARGIAVTNTSGVHAPNISEHVLAMMFAFARRLPFLIRGQSARQWLDEEGRQGVFELQGQTLVVVGLGAIGATLAGKAQALGMNVVGIRRDLARHRDSGIDHVERIEHLPRMLPKADHIAICLPQTPHTIGLFDRDLITRMRPGSFLYNIGRGTVVDTEALVEALRSGHLGGAGLDVTDPEPLPSESPLWDFDNVIITAHTSGSTPRYWERAIEIIAENIHRYGSGEPLRNRVDLALGY